MNSTECEDDKGKRQMTGIWNYYVDSNFVEEPRVTIYTEKVKLGAKKKKTQDTSAEETGLREINICGQPFQSIFFGSTRHERSLILN